MRKLRVSPGMVNESYDVIVIGAGAAGLIAARDLARAGLRVAVLEARGRVGGRISTRRPLASPSIELGPEFVHGDNEILWKLVHEATVATAESPEMQWVATEEGVKRQDDLWERLGNVFKKLDANHYASMGAWLRANRSATTSEDRAFAREYVENFHAAPVDRSSAEVLKDSDGGTDEEQHRVINGYDRVPLFLAQQCSAAGVTIHLNSVVSSIRWRRGEVEARTRGELGRGGAVYRGRAAAVTLPLGVLKALPGQVGAIKFEPDLEEKRALWNSLEMGSVIRVVLRFDRSFWHEPLLPEALRAMDGKNFGFLHAPGAAVPVWWSQSPQPILIGWAGGPAARALTGKLQSEVVDAALSTLASVFGCSKSALSSALLESHWHDWGSDPFCRGGYSYSTAGAEDAPRRMAEAVEGTLFFAGEATADPAELGTVGGALNSGERVASELLRVLGVSERAALS